jgi:hypothetical protein
MEFLETNFKWFFALLALIIVYKFSRDYLSNQNKKHYFSRNSAIKSDILPIKLQAYERLTLFLERMTPTNLLIRIHPISSKKEDYEQLLIQTIEQEFEHNLSQQIYITQECWNVVRTAKSATAALIRKTNMSDKVDTSDKLRETILRDLMDTAAPSDTALQFIKQEVSEII